MSLDHYEFQKAVALLLRCPLPERDPTMLEGFRSLSLDHQRSLELLAVDEEFNKYGREQRDQRWKATFEKLHGLSGMIPDDTLYDIWVDLFEPTHTQLTGDLASCAAVATRAFIDFLGTDPQAKEQLLEVAPESVFDVLKFVSAQIELSQYIVVSTPLRPDSCLVQPHLRLLSLDHDIIGWMETQGELGPEDPVHPPVHLPERRPTLVLMTRTSPGELPRVFEVDEPLYGFVLSQIGQGPGVTLTEAISQDLGTMGLLVHETL